MSGLYPLDWHCTHWLIHLFGSSACAHHVGNPSSSPLWLIARQATKEKMPDTRGHRRRIRPPAVLSDFLTHAIHSGALLPKIRFSWTLSGRRNQSHAIRGSGQCRATRRRFPGSAAGCSNPLAPEVGWLRRGQTCRYRLRITPVVSRRRVALAYREYKASDFPALDYLSDLGF
jgi:hypothetical protein